MANTDMTTYPTEPALVATSDSNSVITLDPSRAYTLLHTGLDVDGDADSNIVYIGTGGEPTATMAAATRKDALIYNLGPAVLGPGLGAINLKTASGAPVVKVYPSEAYIGRF